MGLLGDLHQKFAVLFRVMEPLRFCGAGYGQYHGVRFTGLVLDHITVCDEMVPALERKREDLGLGERCSVDGDAHVVLGCFASVHELTQLLVFFREKKFIQFTPMIH